MLLKIMLLKSELKIKSQRKSHIRIKSQGQLCLFTSYLTPLTSHNGAGVN
jgi:hypothetical protein